VSLTASSFAVAETTLLEDATYFASKMYEASSDNLVSMIRKKRAEIGSNKSWVDKEEVEELNEYVILNHVDCMKEHYINNDSEMRKKNKAGMKFFADALRNDPHSTDLFRMDSMTGAAIDRFLNSKYKGVKSKEEVKEKIKEDYGFNARNLGVGFSDIFYNSSVTEYCKSKSIEEKVTEIAKQ
jgi:hypothetical protein